MMFVNGFGEHNKSFYKQFTLRSHLYDYVTRLRLFHNIKCVWHLPFGVWILKYSFNNNIVPTLKVVAKGEQIFDKLAI